MYLFCENMHESRYVFIYLYHSRLCIDTVQADPVRGINAVVARVMPVVMRRRMTIDTSMASSMGRATIGIGIRMRASMMMMMIVWHTPKGRRTTRQETSTTTTNGTCRHHAIPIFAIVQIKGCMSSVLL